MIALGIDLSSMPAGTAGVLLDGLSVVEVRERCADGDLDEMIGAAEKVGIDAPLGWPDDFVRATGEWTLSEWNGQVRDRLRYRETDRVVHALDSKNRPLSVSSDLIALPAMRAMALLKRHRVTDRSGGAGFFEVYPAASLRAWELPATGYKKDVAARREILAGLRNRFAGLVVDEDVVRTSDLLDGLIAALTTRAAALGETMWPTPEQLEPARREGWIHVPVISNDRMDRPTIG